MGEPAITVAVDPFGGFSVTVRPARDAYPDRTFDDVRAAMGYASGARMVLGLPLVDLVGEGAR